MFRTVIEIVKRSAIPQSSLLPQVKTPLGRWNIHNYSETMLKNKYANEDNCFYSNNYKEELRSLPVELRSLPVESDDNEYMYMMGLAKTRPVGHRRCPYESVHK
jgi:hypothetical protein